MSGTGQDDQKHGPALRIWFLDGPETPGLTLVRVHADSARYCEGASSTMGEVAGGIRALATHSSAKNPLKHRSFDL